MLSLISILQIVVGILLIIGILLQQSATGIEGALGGGSSYESGQSTRRGFEKFTFYACIVLSVLFVIVNVLRLVL